MTPLLLLPEKQMSESLETVRRQVFASSTSQHCTCARGSLRVRREPSPCEGASSRRPARDSALRPHGPTAIKSFAGLDAPV